MAKRNDVFDHVALVDIRNDPIVKIAHDGVRTRSRDYFLDIIILAIGFDAMTGALLRIDITGRSGLKPRNHWKTGPKTYLGLSMAGVPNLFAITAPGSPSVFANMVTSIEQHVDWISDCLVALRARGHANIEALPDAEEAWFAHVNEVGHVPS